MERGGGRLEAIGLAAPRRIHLSGPRYSCPNPTADGNNTKLRVGRSSGCLSNAGRMSAARTDIGCALSDESFDLVYGKRYFRRPIRTRHHQVLVTDCTLVKGGL